MNTLLDALNEQAVDAFVDAVIAPAAAILASDLARTMTATEVNISCGAMMD